MNVAWIGGGSLGLLFAGKFALAGLPARLVVRSSEQLHILVQKGLKLTDDQGRSLTASLSCVGLPEDTRGCGHSPDWVALMVKQTHLDDRFIRQLTDWLHRHAPRANLLCFQNGLGHVERLSRSIAAERIFVAVTTEGALRLGPGEVVHSGRGHTFVGHPADETLNDSPALKKVCGLLSQAGFNTSVSKNINEKVWTKVLINAAINPLTALLGVRNGELLEAKQWRVLMRDIVDEGLTIAQAEGVQLPETLWEEVEDVCRRTAANRSSMLEDVSRRRTTEVDSINGSLCRLADKHRLAVPVNRTLLRLVEGLHR